MTRQMVGSYADKLKQPGLLPWWPEQCRNGVNLWRLATAGGQGSALLEAVAQIHDQQVANPSSPHPTKEQVGEILPEGFMRS
jgi:hypothetical protein